MSRPPQLDKDNNLDIIFIVVALVGGYLAAKHLAVSSTPLANETAVEEQLPAPRKIAKLSLNEESDPVPLPAAGFVKSFGFSMHYVKDVRMYAKPGTLESFPARLQRLVTMLYDDGRALGLDLMNIVKHQAALPDDKAIYIVMTEMTQDNVSIYAFTDKARVF